MSSNPPQKYQALPPVENSLDINKDKPLIPSKHLDQANSVKADPKNTKLTGAELLDMIIKDDETKDTQNDKKPLQPEGTFLYTDFASLNDIKADEEKILTSDIFKTFNENTKKFRETTNWNPAETDAFLQSINENNMDVYKFFDTLNDELDRDLLIWQEDLRIINLQLELWNIAGISMDVTRTETKMNLSRKWLALKETEVAESIKKTNSVKKSIKDSIRKLCNEKENIF